MIPVTMCFVHAFPSHEFLDAMASHNLLLTDFPGDERFDLGPEVPGVVPVRFVPVELAGGCSFRRPDHGVCL